MSLYWPGPPQLVELTHPRLHALVVGVGEYPHLMGGAGHPAATNFGLPQLTTTIHSARRMAEWLVQSYAHPACPLGSVELLISPTQDVPRPDGTPVPAEVPSMDNIADAFLRWWGRCDAREENIAFFYFAGHGLSTLSHYLLAADFGDPALPDLWDNCVDFSGMRLGMRKNKADTQIFFIDACREKPIDALIQNNPHGRPLCASQLEDRVTAAATYHAAAEGLRAYGPANGITYFTSALIEALDGAGVSKKNGQWVVDTFSLGNAIGQIMTSLASIHDQPLTCNPDPEGVPAPIHYPPAARVKTSISCQSAQADLEARIHLQRQAEVHDSPPGEPRPWLRSVTPGDWDIRVDFASFPSVQLTETLLPPVQDIKVPR